MVNTELFAEQLFGITAQVMREDNCGKWNTKHTLFSYILTPLLTFSTSAEFENADYVRKLTLLCGIWGSSLAAMTSLSKHIIYLQQLFAIPMVIHFLI